MADGYPMFEWAPGVPIIDEVEVTPVVEQALEAETNDNNNIMEAENMQHEQDANIEDNVLQQE